MRKPQSRIDAPHLLAALALLSAACGGETPGGDPGGSTSSGGGGSGGSELPPEVPPRSLPGSCGLKAPAFCEDFETPHPGGRSGDLDESMWSFARWGHLTTQHFVRVPSTSETGPYFDITSTFCGKTFTGLLPPNDAVICDGIGVDGLTTAQFNEVYDDQGDFALNSMRVRQLFDFTDRTGTVVFDVDAKINPKNIGHGWWIEFWITDDPAPIPYHEAPGIVPYPRNGLGINFQGMNNCPQGRTATRISRVFVTKEHAIVHDLPGDLLEIESDEKACFKAEDGKPNRFRIKVSKERLEVWVSDFDDAENPHLLAVAPILDLPFSRGYVHLQHSAYNARKDGGVQIDPEHEMPTVTGVQTYRWDNIGFDGPVYAVPRAYEIKNNDEPDREGHGGVLYGYRLSATKWTRFELEGVDVKNATSATFALNTLLGTGHVLFYRLNGGPKHAFTIPAFSTAPVEHREGMRGFALDVPVEELVQGTNTIELMIDEVVDGAAPENVGNMDLSIQANP
jgi:hypothetical protein